MWMPGRAHFGENRPSYERGIRLFDQGRYGEAIEEFERVLETSGDDALSRRLALFYSAEAHVNLGAIYEGKGNVERAVEELEAALAHYAQVVQRDLGVEIASLAGAGAAGGLAGGLEPFRSFTGRGGRCGNGRGPLPYKHSPAL